MITKGMLPKMVIFKEQLKYSYQLNEIAQYSGMLNTSNGNIEVTKFVLGL